MNGPLWKLLLLSLQASCRYEIHVCSQSGQDMAWVQAKGQTLVPFRSNSLMASVNQHQQGGNKHSSAKVI